MFPLLLFSLLLVLCILLAYARWGEPSRLLTRQEKLSAKTEAPLRIVLFGDTHFSEYYAVENMARIAERINSLSPDLVIFTGDFIDSYYRAPPDLAVLEEGLASISARYGKFAVRGNHDIGGGAVRIYRSVMTAGGFRLLVNERITVEGLPVSVTGMDDMLLGHPDMLLPEKAEPMRWNLLLSHEPDLVDRLDVSRFQLILSGHTHGGQVSLPAVTRLFLPPGGKNYRKGLYSLEGGASLYVTSGIGTTHLPLRFGNPPEIVCLDLSD